MLSFIQHIECNMMPCFFNTQHFILNELNIIPVPSELSLGPLNFFNYWPAVTLVQENRIECR